MTVLPALLAGLWLVQAEPDHSRIVFVRQEEDRQSLWTCRPDGSDLRRLTQAGASWALPVWAPDGSRILAARTSPDNTRQLCVIAWPSGEVQPLVSIDGFFGASFSPDLRRIAVADGLRRMTLDVLDVATGRRTRIFDGPGFAAYPSWSPDGASICFQTNMRRVLSRGNGRCEQDELFLCSSDGTGAKPLRDELDRRFSRGVWSPDGKEIATVVGPSKWGHLRIFTAATGELRTVLRGSTPSWGSPAWSPDGRRLACAVELKESSRIALFHRDAPNREPTRMTPEGWTCHSVSWSPRLPN